MLGVCCALALYARIVILASWDPPLIDIPKRDRKQILRQALSIALAVMPFGLAFGIAAREAGLRIYEAMGFSSLVFTGSAQFAAVSVLSDGGSALTAVLAGALLNLRSLAFGVALAPVLKGSRRFRAIAAQLMIDEAAAVGMAQEQPVQRRFGYLADSVGTPAVGVNRAVSAENMEVVRVFLVPLQAALFPVNADS
jgi:hypothetical protein